MEHPLTAVQVKGELNMACCWRVTPLDSVAIKARGLAAEVAQKEDMLALLAEQTLDCSSFLPLRGSSSAGNLQSLMGRKGAPQSEGERPRLIGPAFHCVHRVPS